MPKVHPHELYDADSNSRARRPGYVYRFANAAAKGLAFVLNTVTPKRVGTIAFEMTSDNTVVLWVLEKPTEVLADYHARAFGLPEWQRANGRALLRVVRLVLALSSLSAEGHEACGQQLLHMLTNLSSTGIDTECLSGCEDAVHKASGIRPDGMIGTLRIVSNWRMCFHEAMTILLGIQAASGGGETAASKWMAFLMDTFLRISGEDEHRH
jgi:hypothetical protein